MYAYSSFARTIKTTPQSQPILGKDMVKNNAGGYVFKITPMQQLRRFLILGTEGGTYYAKEKDLTRENAKNIIELMNSEQGEEAVALIHEVSAQNLAPKVSPVLFALALAMSSSRLAVKKEAVKVFDSVVRTHSHLLEVVSYIRQLRGSGRLFKETVQNWYQNKNSEALGYQLAKYRNRKGYTTRDVLRLVKPVPTTSGHDSLYSWAVGKNTKPEHLPAIIEGLQKAYASEKPDLKLIENYHLTWEMVPTQWLTDPKVWEALLPNLGLTALIRNLGRMTSIGLIRPLSTTSKLIASKLMGAEYLHKAGIHPFNVLLALSTYRAGRGVKGELTWNPDPKVSAALEDAFYLSFKNVVPTGKRIILALDVSGSMSASIMNTHLSAREGALAMAMTTMRAEEDWHLISFQDKIVPLNVTARDSLTDAVNKTRMLPFGHTDCAQPFLWAAENNVDADAVVVYTDNETWVGGVHPVQALDMYRNKVGHEVRSVVVGMASTGFSIADPTRNDMMDVVGFDSSAPSLISDFVGGKI